MDITAAADVHELADRVFEEFGVVHVLCNNARVMPVGRILDTDTMAVFGAPHCRYE